MTAAEALYNRGLLSYPRTETDQFPAGFDFQGLIELQQANPVWGAYARALLLEHGVNPPRQGRSNDQAHPPIHTTGYVDPTTLNQHEARVYEFVTRRFLAGCSQDA